jgi:hypothetical protein
VHTPTSRHRELPALQRALTSRLYSLVKCAVNSLRVMSRTCAPFAPAVRAAVWLALGRAIAFDYSAVMPLRRSGETSRAMPRQAVPHCAGWRLLGNVEPVWRTSDCLEETRHGVRMRE